jgi:hypothetical protein
VSFMWGIVCLFVWLSVYDMFCCKLFDKFVTSQYTDVDVIPGH